MTVIPLFATYDITCPDFHSIHTVRAGMYYVLCGMTTTRILRSLRFGSSFSAISDEVQRYLAEISLKIVVMILFSKYTCLRIDFYTHFLIMKGSYDHLMMICS